MSLRSNQSFRRSRLALLSATRSRSLPLLLALACLAGLGCPTRGDDDDDDDDSIAGDDDDDDTVASVCDTTEMVDGQMRGLWGSDPWSAQEVSWSFNEEGGTAQVIAPQTDDLQVTIMMLSTGGQTALEAIRNDLPATFQVGTLATDGASALVRVGTDLYTAEDGSGGELTIDALDDDVLIGCVSMNVGPARGGAGGFNLSDLSFLAVEFSPSN